MASINQLVSEIAHAVGDPNNIALKRNIRYAILHTRNELIRKSYENHSYVDKSLNQRFRLSIIDVPDGDLCDSVGLNLPAIKRTKTKVPRPVRFTNGLPFQSVRSVGKHNVEIAFAKEGTAQFYTHLVGLCNTPVYDYINEYIYFFNHDVDWFKGLGSIIVESVFEVPYIIPEETFESKKDYTYDAVDDEGKFDDDEFLLPEDMIGNIKDIIFKRNLLNVPRETNEVPMDNIVR